MGSQVVFILNFYVYYYALFLLRINQCVNFVVVEPISIGTGALFGCSGAPTAGGGAQIIGGGAGLRRAPAQFNP